MDGYRIQYVRYTPLKTALGAQLVSNAFVKGGVFSITMIYAYIFNTQLLLVLGSVIPTSSMYTELFVSKDRARAISGALVAAFNFGSALAQPVQGWIFKRLSWNRVYPLFCLTVLIGCLIAGASYKRSLVTLFLGRLCTGFVAGNQLFEHILSASIDEKSEKTSLRVLMTIVQLSYMVAFLVAALTLHVAPIETTNDDFFPVNALTCPYYIAAGFAGLLCVSSIFTLHFTKTPPKPPAESTSDSVKTTSELDAILGLLGMAVSFGAPGIFVIGGFVINEETWKFKLVDLSLIIAGLYFVAALTVFFDRCFETKLRRTLLLFALPLVLLGVVPWKGLSVVVSFSLYCVCKPLLTICSRVTYADANKMLLDYAKQHGKDGKPNNTWIVLSGVAVELGLGISLTLGTVFAPEPTGALIVIGLALVYACVVTAITYTKRSA